MMMVQFVVVVAMCCLWLFVDIIGNCIRVGLSAGGCAVVVVVVGRLSRVSVNPLLCLLYVLACCCLLLVDDVVRYLLFVCGNCFCCLLLCVVVCFMLLFAVAWRGCCLLLVVHGGCSR